MDKEYKKMIKRIRDWKGCRAFMFQRDVDSIEADKMRLYNDGLITYDQAIKIEKELDNLLA